jgi:hypothetical protein
MKNKWDQDPNLVKLYQNIYLYKGFLNKHLVEKYTRRLDSLMEEEWQTHYDSNPGDIDDMPFKDRLSLDIISADFHDELLNFFAPSHWMYEHTNFVRLSKGQSFGPENNDRFFINNHPIADYKISLYLGDFKGGKVCFPNQEVEYQPEANDLLIFKVDKDYIHEVKEVESGVRYSYIDYLIHHPGYFFA